MTCLRSPFDSSPPDLFAGIIDALGSGPEVSATTRNAEVLVWVHVGPACSFAQLSKWLEMFAAVGKICHFSNLAALVFMIVALVINEISHPIRCSPIVANPPYG